MCELDCFDLVYVYIYMFFRLRFTSDAASHCAVAQYLFSRPTIVSAVQISLLSRAVAMEKMAMWSLMRNLVLCIRIMNKW